MISARFPLPVRCALASPAFLPRFRRKREREGEKEGSGRNRTTNRKPYHHHHSCASNIEYDLSSRRSPLRSPRLDSTPLHSTPLHSIRLDSTRLGSARNSRARYRLRPRHPRLSTFMRSPIYHTVTFNRIERYFLPAECACILSEHRIQGPPQKQEKSPSVFLHHPDHRIQTCFGPRLFNYSSIADSRGSNTASHGK